MGSREAASWGGTMTEDFTYDGDGGGKPGPRESALPWARQSRTERAFAASIRRRQRQRGNGVARLVVARGYPRSENLRRNAED